MNNTQMLIDLNDNEKKWLWMMDYCKEKNLPPSQNWAWEEAEEAYKEKDLNNER